MGRNALTREEMKVRLHKMKIALYEGKHQHRSGDWHEGAHQMLTEMLNALDEYRH